LGESAGCCPCRRLPVQRGATLVRNIGVCWRGVTPAQPALSAGAVSPRRSRRCLLAQCRPGAAGAVCRRSVTPVQPALSPLCNRGEGSRSETGGSSPRQQPPLLHLRSASPLYHGSVMQSCCFFQVRRVGTPYPRRVNADAAHGRTRGSPLHLIALVGANLVFARLPCPEGNQHQHPTELIS